MYCPEFFGFIFYGIYLSYSYIFLFYSSSFLPNVK